MSYKSVLGLIETEVAIKFIKDTFEKELAKLCDYMAESYNIYPLFVPMQYPLDIEISQKDHNLQKNHDISEAKPYAFAESRRKSLLRYLRNLPNRVIIILVRSFISSHSFQR